MPATKEWISTRRLIAPPPFPILLTGAFALKVTKLRGQRYFSISNLLRTRSGRGRDGSPRPSTRCNYSGASGVTLRVRVSPDGRHRRPVPRARIRAHVLGRDAGARRRKPLLRRLSPLSARLPSQGSDLRH